MVNKSYIIILPLLIAFSCITKTQAELVWPEKVIRYSSKPTTERLESINIDRLLLAGNRKIQMDMLAGLKPSKPDERYSVAFTSPYNESVKFGLSVFEDDDFSPVLKQSTMQIYLKNLSAIAVEEKDVGFEVLMEPEPEGGKTFFRFLGAKPYSVRYAYTDGQNGDAKKMIRQENWALLDGHYYVITIEAPAKIFDSFLASTKQPAGSMHFIDS